MIASLAGELATRDPVPGFPARDKAIFYTTNAIESLNSKLRAAIRIRGHFPTKTPRVSSVPPDPPAHRPLDAQAPTARSIATLAVHYPDASTSRPPLHNPRRPSRHASPRTATSGPAQATCCTWIPRAICASPGRDTQSPVIAPPPAPKRQRVGHEYAHAIIDDHSRLAYAELHPDERADTIVSFTRRALAWYAERGITPNALMTDNAWAYTRSPRFNDLLTDNHVRHLTIQPRRPQTNGKIERFHQTMAREWANGLTYRSSTHRAQALPHWLNHYNEQRPHARSATGHPSAAYATSRGRTSRRRASELLRPSPRRARTQVVRGDEFLVGLEDPSQRCRRDNRQPRSATRVS